MGDRDRPSEIDLAWAAGFLDGDGCFTLMRSAKNQPDWLRYPLITATQTSTIPLDILSKMFGGSVRLLRESTIREKESWIWNIRGAKAKDPILMLLPYLKLKKGQAEIVYEWSCLVRSKGHGRGRLITEAEQELRLDIYDRYRRERESLYGRSR